MKTISTNITHQEALCRDETAKCQDPQANKRLQVQVTQLKEQVNKIEKQTEERICDHQANSSERAEITSKTQKRREDYKDTAPTTCLRWRK